MLNLTGIKSIGYRQVELKDLLKKLQNRKKHPTMEVFVLSEQELRLIIHLLEDLL